MPAWHRLLWVAPLPANKGVPWGEADTLSPVAVWDAAFAALHLHLFFLIFYCKCLRSFPSIGGAEGDGSQKYSHIVQVLPTNMDWTC